MGKKIETVTKDSIYQIFLSAYDCIINENRGNPNFRGAVKKGMKFQDESDLLKYRACIDLLEDTEYALISGFTFQLGNLKNQHYDIGEIYVRLYGILNAVSLQIEAIANLANLINFSYKTNIKHTLQALDIYRLRNIAGAHTIDCRYKFKKNENSEIIGKRSFRIVMDSLTETGESIVAINNFSESETFNLIEVLNEYENESRKIIVEMANYCIDYYVKLKEHKLLLKTSLNEAVNKLIDYKKLDENKVYMDNLYNIPFHID